MKFEINKEKQIDLGIVVKHNYQRNIIIFFNECEDAALYRLLIFRVNYSLGYDGLLCNKDKEYASDYIPTYFSDRLIIKENGSLFGTSIKFTDVNYVTSIENDRNQLYYKLDFLPKGYYIFIIQIENREGIIEKDSIPYFTSENKNHPQ